MWKNLTRLENIPFEGGCLKTRQSWNRQVNRPPCHNKANIIFSTWISYFLWYFFNVLDVSYYVNNNESDYISVLAKINGDKVLGALKRVSQGYLWSRSGLIRLENKGLCIFLKIHIFTVKWVNFQFLSNTSIPLTNAF